MARGGSLLIWKAGRGWGMGVGPRVWCGCCAIAYTLLCLPMLSLPLPHAPTHHARYYTPGGGVAAGYTAPPTCGQSVCLQPSLVWCDYFPMGMAVNSVWHDLFSNYVIQTF